MSETYLLGEKGNGISRRKFLVGTGAVAGAAALFGVPGLSLGQLTGARLAAAQSLNSDMDILQFALTLEHLENAAYRAVNASGLLQGQVAQFFQSFGAHEATHVTALTDTIRQMGGTPVQELQGYRFPTFTGQNEVVTFFAQVEEVGAGAYLGAAPLIKDVNLLAAAAAIHNVEAQHASTLKAVLNDPMPSPAFGTPLSLDQVLAAVGPLLPAAPGQVGEPAPAPAPQPGSGTIGMPRTGIPAVAGPLVAVAGLGAAALGAMLRVRTRNTEETEETTQSES